MECFGQRNIYDLLSSPYDNPLYQESKLYQKALISYDKGNYQKAIHLYKRCLNHGIIHPRIKVGLLNALQQAGKLNDANKYIIEFDSIRNTIYYSIFQALSYIDQHCYNEAQNILITAINSQSVRANYDSIAMGVAYSHLGYLKLFKQIQYVHLNDIGNTGGCRQTSNLDYVDAICCYFRAAQLGVIDSVLVNNVMYLESLFKRKNPDYTLPYELSNFTNSLKKDRIYFEYNLLPSRDTTILEWFKSKDQLLILFDHSGSMNATIRLPDKSKTSRMELMRYEALNILTELEKSDKNIRIGGVSIGDDCSLPPIISLKTDTNQTNILSSMIRNLQASGATPLNQILENASMYFTTDTGVSKAVLLFSDGRNSCSRLNHSNSCYIADLLASQGIATAVYNLLPATKANANELGVYRCLAERSGGILIQINENYELEVESKESIRLQYRLLEIPNFVRDIGHKSQYELKKEYRQDLGKCNNTKI